MKVEIYSDVACPWCYIGKERFERALGAYPGGDAVEVTYRPFQLDPGAPGDAVPLLDYLGRRFGPGAESKIGPVVSAAREEGLTIDFGSAQAANTLGAHRLMWLAEREDGAGVQRALAEALFEAHFGRGWDIGDPEVLAGLAAEVGMDRERARAYLASDEGRIEVEREIEESRRLGITAVPTFVFDGKYAVQGAQPASAFLRALEAVERETQASAGAEDGSCADGSCGVRPPLA